MYPMRQEAKCPVSILDQNQEEASPLLTEWLAMRQVVYWRPVRELQVVSLAAQYCRSRMQMRVRWGEELDVDSRPKSLTESSIVSETASLVLAEALLDQECRSVFAWVGMNIRWTVVRQRRDVRG